MQVLELEVKHLQLKLNIPEEEMIDFHRLKIAFFKEKKYSYGIPIKEKEKFVVAEEPEEEEKVEEESENTI